MHCRRGSSRREDFAKPVTTGIPSSGLWSRVQLLPPDEDVGMTGARVGELTREECLRGLSSTAVGRFVFTVGALPAVVPVTFALDGEVAVCCTSAGSRLARAAAGGVLALQADDIDVASRSGWSVVATGVAEVVRDPAEVSRITGLVRPWVPGTLDVAIRLPLTVLTGRRVDTTAA